MKIFKEELEKYLNSYAGEYREIFFEKSKSFSFTCVNGKFKVPRFSNLEGFSVLSRAGKKEYFKSYSGLENIDEKINSFKKDFSLIESTENISLKGEGSLELKNIEEISFDLENIIKSTNELFESYIKTKDFIVSSEISLILSRKSFIVGNSSGNFSIGTNFYNTYFIKMIGEKDGIREEIYEKITGTDILEKFVGENFEKTLKLAINTLEKQLSGEKSPSGKIDVIIANSAGGTIIHEAVGHGLEADLQNSSVYAGKIGEKVASDLVTIVDNPTIIGERGHYKYDHEGNPARNAILIEKGVLKTYMHNEKTSKKFGVENTSHGRKETYKHKTMVRMGNTYMMPGNDKKEDLIKNIKYGVYVSRIGGGQVNIITGDFVFKVQNGYLIEDGKFTKNIVGATLSGNGPEMLNEIYGVCDDLDFFDGGTCGKIGQSMPVSDGVPTIWTKLKVSS